MTISLNVHSNDPEQEQERMSHEQDMADKYDNRLDSVNSDDNDDSNDDTDSSNVDIAEEKILGKFNNYDDLQEAYKELERKFTEVSTAKNNNIDDTNNNDKEEKYLTEVHNYYRENGKLESSHYDKLSEMGVPKEFMENYISGLDAKDTLAKVEIFKDIGGEDKFKNISNWAQANISKDELSKYNEAVASGNNDTVGNAVRSLAYKYNLAMGSDPTLVGGENALGRISNTFESAAQVTEAMKDPRYAKDSAYRQKVVNRLSGSNIF